jgi:predicted naringenin-chalcone synthase
MGRIISIGTAVPQFSSKQARILNFMQSAYGDETASRKLNILFHSSGISSRHSVLPDFGETQPDQELFFGEVQPGVDERMAVYQEQAVVLAIEAIQIALQKINIEVDAFGITHLITVSCTGLQAPGLDAAIMEKLGLPNDIFHTSINFAGCNAAFPALKIANMITKTEENAKVLVVCVELCTLHFQPKNNHDNLLSNTIFGDGAAAVLMVSEPLAEKQNLKGLSINGFYSTLLSEGKHLMGWQVTPINFEMVLNAKVPAFIGKKINELMNQTLQKLDINLSDIGKWAVHPGGRKILDEVKTNLKLADGDLSYSYHVLNECGNMSSPTILFILNKILENPLAKNEKVLAIGFGPGISVDTALFAYAE